MLKRASRKYQEDDDTRPDDEQAPVDSLDRLADFTRRIIAVPKVEVSETKRKSKKKR